MNIYPQLRKLWSRAPEALVRAIASQMPSVASRYGINSPLRMVHFLAQISHESEGGTITRENMNYTTAARIAAVWPKRFTVESAQEYVRNPEKLANKVYSGRMGNTHPGDGFKYRGRGLLQLTGRESYRKMSRATGLDLEGNPDLAFDPGNALKIAAAEFVALGCLPFCDKDDLRRVTLRVNGGTTGLESRKNWLVKWKAALLNFQYDEAETADIEAEPIKEPRGGDNEPTKPMSKSVIGNSQIAVGGTTAATVGATVIDKAVNTDPAPAERITEVIDRAGSVVSTTSTVIESVPEPSALKNIVSFITDPVVLGVIAAVVVALCAWTWLERRRHARDGDF